MKISMIFGCVIGVLAMMVIIPTSVQARRTSTIRDHNFSRTLSGVVDEVRDAIYTYSPDVFSLIKLVADYSRDNQPISQNFAKELRSAFGERTINEHIANFGYSVILNRPLLAMITTSHYAKHTLQRSDPWNGHVYLVSGIPLTVPHMVSEITPTSESMSSFPRNTMRDQMFNLYFSSESTSSSNVSGVLGLLDEFSAYAFDTILLIDLYYFVVGYYENNGFTSFVRDYIYMSSAMQKQMDVFFLATLHHLIWLEQNRPGEFSWVMANTEYRRAFSYYVDRRNKLLAIQNEKMSNPYSSLPARVVHLPEYRENLDRFLQRRDVQEMLARVLVDY